MPVKEHDGAVEVDKPTDPQQGNANAQNHGGLDDQGLPKDCDKIESDRIGAVMDETQG